MKITKAILPVAGLGKRMMPLTLHQPKAMIAVADRPIIHYVIDEIISSGIEEIILVLGPDQEVFKKYLDYLKKDGAWKNVNFYFARQDGPHGSGDAIYAAKIYFDRGEPLAVAFPDDFFDATAAPLKDMARFFSNLDAKNKSPIILAQKIPKKDIHLYGVVKKGAEKSGDFFSVIDLMEKPEMAKNILPLGVIGRYVLPYEIFSFIEKLFPYQGKEIGLAAALQLYIREHQKIWATTFDGIRFDAGSIKGLIKAQAYFAVNHPLNKR